jgi:hypothetical protein
LSIRVQFKPFKTQPAQCSAGSTCAFHPASKAWRKIIEFQSKEAQEKFEAQVLDELRRTHPRLFKGEGAP